MQQLNREKSLAKIKDLTKQPRPETPVEGASNGHYKNKGSLSESKLSNKRKQKKAKIHLEIETGMNRTGFENDELEIAIDLIQRNSDYLFLEGICTHYAGAESIANYVRVNEQYENFIRITRNINEKMIDKQKNRMSKNMAAFFYII